MISGASRFQGFETVPPAAELRMAPPYPLLAVFPEKVLLEIVKVLVLLSPWFVIAPPSLLDNPSAAFPLKVDELMSTVLLYINIPPPSSDAEFEVTLLSIKDKS